MQPMLIDALGLDRSRVIALCGAGGKTTLMFALAREYVARGERVLLTTTTHIASDEAEGPWPSFSAIGADQVLDGVRRLLPRAGGRRSGAVVAYSSVSHDGRKVAGLAPGVVDQVSGFPEIDRILVEADGAARRPLKASAAHEPVVPSSTDTVVLVLAATGIGLPLRDDTVYRPTVWARLTGIAPGAPVTARSLADVVRHPEGFGKARPPHARGVLFLNRADTPEREEVAARVIECLASSGGDWPGRVVAGSLLPEPRVATIVGLIRDGRRVGD